MIRSALVLLLTVFLACPAYAAKEKSTSNFAGSSKTQAASAQSAPAAPAAPKVDREALKKKIEEKKAELNGSEWEVEVSSEGKVLSKDTFTFQNQQVTCKTLKDRSYPATNYTVSLPDGADMAVWETMQTSSKGDVVFIRGEWKEGMMRGVMSEQLGEGKNKDYTFASLTKTAVPATTPKEEEKKEEPVAPPVVLDAPEAPVVEAPIEEIPSEEVPPVAAFAPGTTEELGR